MNSDFSRELFKVDLILFQTETMFSKYTYRRNLDGDNKKKTSVKKENPSLNPFLLDIYKARGLKHQIVKLKQKERSSKIYLEHCEFLQNIVTPAEARFRDSEETKQAVRNIPVLMAASIQPSSADKYLREFRHFAQWGKENGRITSPPLVSTIQTYLVILLHRSNSLD